MALNTAAQLNALPYSKSPFGQGITSDDYRKQFRLHGEPIRHFRCFSDVPDNFVGPNGETHEGQSSNVYIENVLPTDVRVLISQTSAMVENETFGQLQQGETGLVSIPDEVEFTQGDRIIPIWRRAFARLALQPSGAARDELAIPFVAEIVSLSHGDGALDVDASGRSYIAWTGAPPATCFIEIRYCPQFTFLGAGDKLSPIGADGKRLPQRGTLTLEHRKP